MGITSSAPDEAVTQIESVISRRQYDASAWAQPELTLEVLSAQKSQTACVELLIDTRHTASEEHPRSVVGFGAVLSYSVALHSLLTVQVRSEVRVAGIDSYSDRVHCCASWH
jgi:hypothetical protein